MNNPLDSKQIWGDNTYICNVTRLFLCPDTNNLLRMWVAVTPRRQTLSVVDHPGLSYGGKPMTNIKQQILTRKEVRKNG